MKEKISEFVYSHREEMVDIIRQLVEIPSVKGKPEQSAPFGAEPRRALDKMLEICREHGFVTGCHDNVMGTADYAPSGKVGLGILCHLDVVPGGAAQLELPAVPAHPPRWKAVRQGSYRRQGTLRCFADGAVLHKGARNPAKKGSAPAVRHGRGDGSEDLRSTAAPTSCRRWCSRRTEASQ